MNRTSCVIAATAILLAIVPPRAGAESVPPSIDDLLTASPPANDEAAVLSPVLSPVLSNDELDGQRGGLRTPLGIDVGFGASVRTFIDGALVLESRLTWTETGPRTEEIVNDLGSITGAPVTLGTLGGVVANPPGGATTVIHNLAMDRIANMIINTADNRSIRQETNITLVLPQLLDIQQRVAADRLASTLQSSLGVALRDAATTR